MRPFEPVRRTPRAPCPWSSGVAGCPWVWASIGVPATSHGDSTQSGDDGAEPRQPDLVDRGADRERVGEVVDVLAGAGEVGQFGDVVQPEGVQSFARTRYSTAFTSCLVVASSVGQPSISALPEVGRRARAARGPAPSLERRRAEHPVAGQSEQPLDLDLHACPVEARLREVLAEPLDGSTIASVEGADRLRGKRAHETPCRIPGSSWWKSAVLARSIVASTLSNRAASE